MSQRSDPHAEAVYWVIPLEKEAFAVEVITPWNHPTTVSKFTSAAAAKSWIAAHKVADGDPLMRRPVGSGSGRRSFIVATETDAVSAPRIPVATSTS